MVAKGPSANMTKVADLSLRKFVSNSISDKLPVDPAERAKVKKGINALSDTTTVGDLLALSKPIKDHPLFQKEVNAATVAGVVATSPSLAGNQTLQDTFLNQLAANQSSMPQFWQSLAQQPGFSQAIVQDIQVTLQLGLLTQNNVNLIGAIRAKAPLQTMKDLTKLTNDDWTAMVTRGVDSHSFTVPDGVPGATSDEKVRNYVNGITSLLQAAFPTAYIATGVGNPPTIDTSILQKLLRSNPNLDFASLSQIDRTGLSANELTQAALLIGVLRQESKMFPGFDFRSAIDLSSGGVVNLANPIRNDLSQFFGNCPDFDFKTANVDAYVSQNSATAFKGVNDQTRLIGQLKAMQRVFQMAPSYGAMSTLMGYGIDSAHMLTTIPQESFVKQFASQLGGEAIARLVYAKAEYINGATLQTFALIREALSGVRPRVAAVQGD